MRIIKYLCIINVVIRKRDPCKRDKRTKLNVFKMIVNIREISYQKIIREINTTICDLFICIYVDYYKQLL